MLSLDRVKTITIYSTKQINLLYHNVSQKQQNQAYQSQSNEDFLDFKLFLKMIYILLQVPNFGLQLNQMGDIAMTSNLQILYVKASTWRAPFKQDFRNLASLLLVEYEKYSKNFKRKENINPKTQITIQAIPFFENALSQWTTNASSYTSVLISSFRIFIINELHKKKTEFIFKDSNGLIRQWQAIQHNLISASKIVDTLKHQQICISISYWLCSLQKLFIQQCLKGGMVNFLLKALSRKEVSQWYGRKIINFLKLLILESPVNSVAITEFQNSLSKFSQFHDKPEVLALINDLMQIVESKDPEAQTNDKFQKLKGLYIKYTASKTDNSLIVFLDYLRVIILYGKSQTIKKDLSKQENINFIMQSLKQQTNLTVIKQLLTLLLTHSQSIDQNEAAQIMEDSINKIQKIISMNQKGLKAENKKHLISICKILKQILNRKDTYSKMVEIMKKLKIEQKLLKFSDGKILAFERHLYQLRRVMMPPTNKIQNQQQQQLDSKNVLQALQNQFLANRLKKTPGYEQLEQARLLNEIITKDPAAIKIDIVKALPRTIYQYGDQNSQTSNTILDNSESQQLRNIKNQLNYYAIDSLNKTVPFKSNQEVSKDESVLEKVVKTGAQARDNKVLEVSAKYIKIYLEKFQITPRLIQSLRIFQNKLSEERHQQDAAYLQTKLKKLSEPKVPVQIVLKFLDRTLELSNIGQLKNQEHEKVFQVLPDLQLKSLNQVLKKLEYLLQNKSQNADFLKVYLALIYKMSQKENQKKNIFQALSDSLRVAFFYWNKKQGKEASFQQITSLLYLIFSELFPVVKQGLKQSYFQQILKQSYGIVSKQSVKFSQQCLAVIPYSPPNRNDRKQSYFKFIYSNGQIIGREAFHLIKNDEQQEDAFWLKYNNLLASNLQKNAIFNLNFMQLYIETLTQKIWDKHQIQTIYRRHLTNCLKCLQKIQNEANPSSQNIRIFKSLLRIIKAGNKNENLNLGTQYNEQNQIMVHCAQVLGEQISNKPALRHQLMPLILQILSILILMYRNHDGSKILIEQANRCANLWKVLQKLSDQQINDLCLQIVRIGLVKDLKQKQHPTFQKFMQSHKDSWANVITSQGATHLDAIYRILKAKKQAKQKTIKSEALLYFFGEGQNLQNFYKQQEQQTLGKAVSTKQLGSQLSDQQLLKLLKNLVHPPYIYGLNILINQLRKVESNEFSNTLVKVFCQSQALRQQDKVLPNKSLQQTQTVIAKCISPAHTDLSEQFYQMISMNRIGMQICLHKKKIGVRGITIVCQRMNNDQNSLLLCSNILHLNARSQKQLSVLHTFGIYKIINNSYPGLGVTPQFAKSLGNLIGSSSKLKKNQEAIKIISNLLNNIQRFADDPQSLASTFYAMSGLVYQNKQNQSRVGIIQMVRLIMQMIMKHMRSHAVVEKGANLLSNLIYKNYSLKKIYVEVQVPQKILEVIKGYLLEQKYPHDAVKQILKLLGNLALDFQVAYKMANSKFMAISKLLIIKAQQAQHDDIIKYTIDVLYNMAKHPDIQVKAIALKFYQEGYVPCVFGVIKAYLLNSQIIESCLDSYDYLCQLDLIHQSSLENNIFGLMGDIQKTQELNEQILDQWIRILYKICKEQRHTIKMLESGVLLNGASFIKAHQKVQHITIQISFGIIEKVEKLRQKFFYVKSGYVDFIIQLLCIRNIPNSDISRIIDTITAMHQKKLLNTQLYVKIFEALLDRLQIQYKDQNARKIVAFMKRIKQKVILNTRSEAKLLEFSYYFLTQKQIITSSKYHMRVREFISLLAYLNGFNTELRMMFREQGFLSILRNWIKIDTLIHQDNTIIQACRMCLVTILNDQKFLVTINENANVQKAKVNMITGYKSMLYRKDKSNKNAITKFDNQKIQIQSFKAPNGEIKTKYVLPLLSIITFRYNYQQGDQAAKQSLFQGAGSMFSKAPVMKNCVTFYGLVGDQLSIRQFNLQFQTEDEKNRFAQDLKIIVSAQFRKLDYY